MGSCAPRPGGVADISNAIMIIVNETLNQLILKPSKSNVTEEYFIHIINCTLSGVLRPEKLFNFEALEHLDVSFNSFTALPIPAKMGLLKNLKYLNPSTTGFAGIIP